MAVPAKTYATNWLYYLNCVGITLVAPLIVYFFLPFYRKLDVTTAYEYLEKRFSSAVRMTASASYVLYQLCRMGIILFLPAIAINTVTGMNIYLCIALMGVICTIYTLIGGIEAVVWTDVIQVVILLGGAIISIFVIALGVQGGFAGIIRTGIAAGKFHMMDWNMDFSEPVVWVLILSWIGQLVPYASDQTVIQRYLTTKDERSAAKGIWTNAIMSLPSCALFFFIGTALFAFYKDNPSHLNSAVSNDSIFPWFIMNELPTGVSGLVITAIMAAAMSTLSSILNSMSAACITDFFRKFRPDAPDSRCLMLAKWLTLGFGIFGVATAFFMASFRIESLWDLFLKILGLLGGGLTGLFLLGIFTVRASAKGALFGFFTSAVVQYFVQSHTDIHFFLYPVTGILSCVVSGYAASLFFKDGKEISGLTVWK